MVYLTLSSISEDEKKGCEWIRAPSDGQDGAFTTIEFIILLCIWGKVHQHPAMANSHCEVHQLTVLGNTKIMTPR